MQIQYTKNLNPGRFELGTGFTVVSHLYIYSDLSVITWFCLSTRYSRIYTGNGPKLLGQQLLGSLRWTT